MPVMNSDAMATHSLLRKELDMPEHVSLMTMVRTIIAQRDDAVERLVFTKFKHEGTMPMCGAETSNGNPCSCEGNSNYSLTKDGEFAVHEILCGIHYNQRIRKGWSAVRIGWKTNPGVVRL